MSCVHLKRLIHTRAVTHSYMWLIYIVQTYVLVRVTRLIHTRAVTHSYACRDWLIYITHPYCATCVVVRVTRPIHTRAVTHSYTWHDSFTYMYFSWKRTKFQSETRLGGGRGGWGGGGRLWTGGRQSGVRCAVDLCGFVGSRFRVTNVHMCGIAGVIYVYICIYRKLHTARVNIR